MFLKPKHFIFECRPNFGSFYPLPGLLRAITFSAPKPPPLQISAYATAREPRFAHCCYRIQKIFWIILTRLAKI